LPYFHIRARRMRRCMQCEWALWHRTSPYIDARGPMVTQVAVLYIRVRNASMYGAVRKADTSNAWSKTCFKFDACHITWKFQPCHWPLLEYFAFLALHALHCVLLEIALNTGSACVGRRGGVLSSGAISMPNAWHVGPFYGASVLYIAVVCNWQRTVLSYGEALADRIVSYRIAMFCVISYRIVSIVFSLMAVSCHH